MKKLTKDERWVAYVIMLHEIESGNSYFFCRIISFFFGLSGTDENMKRYFPELYRKRPKGLFSGSSWFPYHTAGRVRRIELLKQCIEETS